MERSIGVRNQAFVGESGNKKLNGYIIQMRDMLQSYTIEIINAQERCCSAQCKDTRYDHKPAILLAHFSFEKQMNQFQLNAPLPRLESLRMDVQCPKTNESRNNLRCARHTRQTDHFDRSWDNPPVPFMRTMYAYRKH
jgi:hypothetical protein